MRAAEAEVVTAEERAGQGGLLLPDDLNIHRDWKLHVILDCFQSRCMFRSPGSSSPPPELPEIVVMTRNVAKKRGSPPARAVQSDCPGPRPLPSIALQTRRMHH